MKTCKVCDEKFDARGRQVYCSPMCRRIALRRRRGHTVHAKTCVICGSDFASTRKNARFCGEHSQSEVKAFYNGYKSKLGVDMECGCCGGTIKRNGPNQKFCKGPCRPPPGKTMVCARCGVDKPMQEYSDYRGQGRKLHTVCIECLRADARERARKRKLMNIEQDKVKWIAIHSELGMYDLSYARGLAEFRVHLGRLIDESIDNEWEKDHI